MLIVTLPVNTPLLMSWNIPPELVSEVTVYLNGKEEIAGEAAMTVPAKCGQIFFGGRCDKFAGLEGRMDEAAIYNRALPAKEIADHFAAAGK